MIHSCLQDKAKRSDFHVEEKNTVEITSDELKHHSTLKSAGKTQRVRDEKRNWTTFPKYWMF